MLFQKITTSATPLVFSHSRMGVAIWVYFLSMSSLTQKKLGRNAHHTTKIRRDHYGEELAHRLANSVTTELEHFTSFPTFKYGLGGSLVGTNVPVPADNGYGAADHERYDVDRHLIDVIMNSVQDDKNDIWDQSTRWQLCRSPKHMFVAECTNCECEKFGDQMILPNSCEVRICPTCHKRHIARAIDTFVPVIRELWQSQRRASYMYRGYRLRAVTLTSSMSVMGCSLSEARERIKLFNSHVQQLIASFGWNQGGAGCYRATEIGERGFKIHAHLLVWSKHVKQEKLSEMWRRISGDYVVWISDAQPKTEDDIRDSVAESVKYVIKLSKYKDGQGGKISPRAAAQQLGFSLEEVFVRVQLAFHGIRRVQGYGIFFGLSCEEIKLICSACEQPLAVSKFNNEVTTLNLIRANNSNSSPRAPPQNNYVQLSYWEPVKRLYE